MYAYVELQTDCTGRAIHSHLLVSLPTVFGAVNPHFYGRHIFFRDLGCLIEVDSDSHVLWVAGCCPEGLSRGCRAGGPGIFDVFPRTAGTTPARRAGVELNGGGRGAG